MSYNRFEFKPLEEITKPSELLPWVKLSILPVEVLDKIRFLIHDFADKTPVISQEEQNDLDMAAKIVQGIDTESEEQQRCGADNTECKFFDLSDAPKDILKSIFNNLSIYDFLRVRATSKEFNRVIDTITIKTSYAFNAKTKLIVRTHNLDEQGNLTPQIFSLLSKSLKSLMDNISSEEEQIILNQFELIKKEAVREAGHESGPGERACLLILLIIFLAMTVLFAVLDFTGIRPIIMDAVTEGLLGISAGIVGLCMGLLVVYRNYKQCIEPHLEGMEVKKQSTNLFNFFKAPVEEPNDVVIDFETGLVTGSPILSYNTIQ